MYGRSRGVGGGRAVFVPAIYSRSGDGLSWSSGAGLNTVRSDTPPSASLNTTDIGFFYQFQIEYFGQMDEELREGHKSPLAALAKDLRQRGSHFVHRQWITLTCN